jgi:hypothetical protein
MKLHKCISLSSYYSSYKYFTDLTCELYETGGGKKAKKCLFYCSREWRMSEKGANDIQWHSAESFLRRKRCKIAGIRVEVSYVNGLTSKVKREDVRKGGRIAMVRKMGNR